MMHIRSVLLSLFMFVSSPAWADDLSIPDEIYGSYAPGGDCSRQPRVTVGKEGLFLDTAAGKSGPLPVSVCYSCAGGARYEGIQRWIYVKYGKDKWGGDNMPVTFMFNHGEKKGAMEVVHDDTLKTPLGAAMNQAVQAKAYRICRPGTVATAAAAARPILPGATPGTRAPVATTPVKGLAMAIGALLRPASLPANSFYDWRWLETVPAISWATLPPQMLDKPMSNGELFRRSGTASVGGQTIKVLAGGARTMVMNLYFRNDGPPLGEDALLTALREGGYAVTRMRCGKAKTMPVPTWYRLSGSGKQAGILWIAPSRGAQQPWEGFSLRLDGVLPPLTARETPVYTDRCS